MSEYQLAPWVKTLLVFALIVAIVSVPMFPLAYGYKGGFLVAVVAVEIVLLALAWSERGGRYTDLIAHGAFAYPLTVLGIWADYHSWAWGDRLPWMLVTGAFWLAGFWLLDRHQAKRKALTTTAVWSGQEKQAYCVTRIIGRSADVPRKEICAPYEAGFRLQCWIPKSRR